MSRARQELIGASLVSEDSGKRGGSYKRKSHDERVREIPPDVLTFTPERLLDLDAHLFGKCLSSAPSGCAPGPGGCTNEMLKVCLEDRQVLQLLFRAAEDAARRRCQIQWPGRSCQQR